MPAVAGSVMQSDQAVVDTATVRLGASSAVFPTGEPVVLNASMVNTTRHEFTFWVARSGPDTELYYDFVGKDSDGKELARTAYGKWLQAGNMVMISRIQKTLKPDESFGETIDASKIFDISRPGQYSFQVKREYLLNEKVDIKSNIVTVEVK